MEQILIIEDDPTIQTMLQQLLTLNHYQPISAYSGTEGVLLHQADVSLILLDLMLPGKKGEEIIRELQAKKKVPIIVMSAIHEIETKLDLFSLGADDYLTKPFDNEELLARIRVQLRHRSPSFEQPFLKVKEITLNPTTYQVFYQEKELNFSKTEFELLKVLMEHAGQVVTKSILFDTVWDRYDSADENTLNVHISKIRTKLKQVSDDDYIETVWSIGYRMNR